MDKRRPITFVFAISCLSAAWAEDTGLPFDPTPGRPYEPARDSIFIRRTAAKLPGPDLTEVANEERRRWRTRAIIAANAAAVAIYGKNNWWENGFSGNFRTINEGWFGPHTYAGGADKLGHFFSNYASTRLLKTAFDWAGNTSESSLGLAALTTLATFTGVEVLDGFAKDWHFSKEDAIMNILGIGAGLLFEKKPELDRVLDLRLRYWPSSENDRRFDPGGDYSGQTYLLIIKASGIPALRSYRFSRYLEFAVGYGTRSYIGNREETRGSGNRNIYYGISLNLSTLLGDTAFARNAQPTLTQKVTDTALEYIQVPGTVVLGKRRLPRD